MELQRKGAKYSSLYLISVSQVAVTYSRFHVLISLSGPIADTCTDLPYEKLNTLQDVMLAPGRNVYMGGSSYIASDTVAPLKIYDKIVELNSIGPEIQYSALFEYFGMDVVNSVPSDATAFPSRGHQSNCGIVALWDEPSDERQEKAKAGVNALKRIMLGCQDFSNDPTANTGYANFGEY